MPCKEYERLRKPGKAYGPSFSIESPVEGELPGTLKEMARGFADRLVGTFTRGADGRRPAHGRYEKFQSGRHWRDPCYSTNTFTATPAEGLGASHQTGWTALVASLIDEWRQSDSRT
jgi:hypothetical protein